MAEIDNNSNATQLLEAVNTAFGSATGIQEILASDNAADLIEKLNHNFEVMGTGGDAVFPANTILPCNIGNLAEGEDIGGMTMEDFIAYGIQSMPRKLTFLHCSDTHGSNTTMGPIKDAVEADSELGANSIIDFVILTGDITSGTSGDLYTSITDIATTGKMLAVPGNHDAYDGAGKGNISALQTYIKALMTDGEGSMCANFGSKNEYGCYWYRDFPLGKGKLRLIGIDEYNFIDSGKAHKVYFTQVQINWLVDLLTELNGNDYLLLAQHTPPMPYTNVKDNEYNIMLYRRANKFCSSRLNSWGSLNNDPNADFIPAIIDAYLKKEQINKTRSEPGPSVTVNVDFSTFTPARFIGWLTGHLHADIHHAHPKYTNQLVMCVDCGMTGISKETDIRQNDSNSFQTRASGVLYNRVTIDILKETIKIERVGNQQTVAHTVDPVAWNGGTYYPETLDPHWDNPDYPNGWTYPKITRDEITFDLNAMK